MTIVPHDLTLIHHELVEMDLIQKGYSQDGAHEIASEAYNYTEESYDYYMRLDSGNKSHQGDTDINSGGIRKLSRSTH